MTTIRPLLPSLREKHRYLHYAVFSEKQLAAAQIRHGIQRGLMDFLGVLGYGKAGIQMIDNTGTGGILRMNRAFVDEVKSGLLMITSVADTRSAVRSTRVSGMIHKVQEIKGGL